MFRSGNEDAFRAIHDRYRPRMLAYTRQMLSGSPQDPEDAVQEVFVRAYAGLRASQRELALRAWLYRIAHNRCIDELRRPHPPVLEAVEGLTPAFNDPVAKVEQRESLRRLIADVQRLPEQQRSALLMRELGGMPYIDVAGALSVSVPAVKSLLVRARVGLAQASEARDTACAEIRDDLIASHDRGVRTSALARRHMRDCPGCRSFRSEIRGVSRQFAALTPTLGPIGVIANLLGWGGGGGGAAAGGGALAGGGAAAVGTGAASVGVFTGASHVATILAAAVVATGGAVEIQHTLAGPATHRSHHHAIVAAPKPAVDNDPAPAATPSAPAVSSVPAPDPDASFQPAAASPGPTGPAGPASSRTPAKAAGASAGTSSHVATTAPVVPRHSVPITQVLDPDMMYTQNATTSGNGSTSTGSGGSTATKTPGAKTTTGTATGTGTSTTPTATTGTGGGATGTTTGATGTGSTTAGDTTTGTTGSGGTTTGATGTGGTTTGGTATGGTGTQTGAVPTTTTTPTGTGTGSTGTATGSTQPTAATSSATHVTKLRSFGAMRK